jgi:hypothetical protein
LHFFRTAEIVITPQTFSKNNQKITGTAVPLAAWQFFSLRAMGAL